MNCVRQLIHLHPPAFRHICRRGGGRQSSSKPPQKPHQAFPLHGFYLDLLTHPLTPANASPPGASLPDPDAPASTPSTEPFSPNKPVTETQESEREARARIIFGSRLAGPGSEAERQRIKREKGEMIAGVWVPPRPVEPDNCCMSGCVNCVLSQFIEDLDEWKKAKRKAEERLQMAERGEDDAGIGDNVGESLWEGFEDIPVGLRVFMETEKRLKEKEKEKEKQ